MQDRALIRNFKSELPANLNYMNNRSAFYNRIEGHEGSKVISRAAYLMHKYGIPDSYAARIWFYSMDYLPKGADVATFYDWRSALEQASNDVLNKCCSNTRTLQPFNLSLCDVNKDGNITSTDLSMLRQAVNSDGYFSF